MRFGVGVVEEGGGGGWWWWSVAAEVSLRPGVKTCRQTGNYDE